LESQKSNDGDHDIGFRMMCSYGNGYDQTQNLNYRNVLLTAAQTLASRYDSKIGCIKSWDWKGNFAVIIDNMMNLELLFWAAQYDGYENLYDMAVSHAYKTIQNHVRNDGSTYHVVDYNNDGSVNWKDTQQGYNAESTWSRGQAWGLYGFTMTYRYTHLYPFLATAIKLADYFIGHLPSDFVPYSDFNAPGIPDVEKDASAAAIACAALFELDTYAPKKNYQKMAEDILQSLMCNYLAKNKPFRSILYRASQWYNDEERGTIYADYYFLQALKCYQQLKTDIEQKPETTPEQFVRVHNYPNPFNSSTTISFQLHKAEKIVIDIYNSLGEHIVTLVDSKHGPGHFQIKWAPYQLSGGIYFYRLKIGLQEIVKKMILLK
jgi:hypothetical protein